MCLAQCEFCVTHGRVALDVINGMSVGKKKKEGYVNIEHKHNCAGNGIHGQCDSAGDGGGGEIERIRLLGSQPNASYSDNIRYVGYSMSLIRVGRDGIERIRLLGSQPNARYSDNIRYVGYSMSLIRVRVVPSPMNVCYSPIPVLCVVFERQFLAVGNKHAHPSMDFSTLPPSPLLMCPS